MDKTEEGERIGMNAAEYSALFSEVRNIVGDRDVAVVILQEMAKDMRANQIRRERQRAGDSATKKQKAYMRRLGIEFKPDVTFEEASELIDEALEREG